MADILVTGGGGFLGRHIVNLLLERGDSVSIFNRSIHKDLEERGVTCFTGDLRDYNAVKNAVAGKDTVFHVAAKAGVWGPIKDYYGINFTGTENILKACHEHGVKKLIYTSSPSVAFGTEAIENGDESLPYPESYLTSYPETKAKAEKMVLEANSDKLLTCALRPHLIWGPGDNHLIPRVLETAGSGKLMQVGDGTNLVDITYVENGAKAHIQAEEALKEGSPVAGQAYFIGDQKQVNIWQWINDLLKEAGVKPVTKSISYSKAKTVGAILEMIYKIIPLKGEPRMTRFVAAQLAKSHYFSHAKAQKDFGYDPEISNEEGMKRTLEWLKGRNI
ncbi:MAG: NAD-dependent epimerase/dehydratase family protein [Lentisphaeraceae bacterium]|nr:NAD-dependent epimerase/dehydratase family protein [Lentisphaeraceae bacterium]